jgi:hypothetical protein
MGNTRKRRAVVEFIEHRELPVVDGTPDSSESATGGPDVPLDEEWLEDIRNRRDRLAARPEEELAIYREFFKAPNLTAEQMDILLATMEKAVGQPEKFYDDLVSQESVLGGAGSMLSCAVKIPRYFPTRPVNAEQQAAIDTLRKQYPVLDGIEINPNEHKYEFCDPSWWPLFRAKLDEQIGRWPGGLDNFVSHTPDNTFVYEGAPETTKVALMSDFGVGQYQSHAIARQLARHRYPYLFHLGDVYYAGTSQEFADNYEKPLDPVMNVSKLFSIAENHELYGRGTAYLAFLKKEKAKGRIEQDGSYFCVRFPKHQFIAIDVNWNGRQRFAHEPGRAWLKEVLKSGEGLTTILLTGSAPFEYGSSKASALYRDMSYWIEGNSIDMWFWGDDHYCTLFQREASSAPFIASCIGHGGYPGDVQPRTPALDAKSLIKPLWVETAARFPQASGLRPDLSNNGWVELTMRDDGGVDLLYVDWLGAKRFQAKYRLDPGSNANFNVRSLQLETSEEFDRTTLYD